MTTNTRAHYMALALAEARKATPKPSNFCVGALLVSEATDKVLSTGYTGELPGNTHAEQCCLAKFAAEQHDNTSADAKSAGPDSSDVNWPALLPGHLNAVLYTTVEPCVERLSGNVPCLERILATRSRKTSSADAGDGTDQSAGAGIRTVYVGLQEPETFVKANSARARLEAAGIAYVHVAGSEREIERVATAGHRDAAA